MRGAKSVCADLSHCPIFRLDHEEAGARWTKVPSDRQREQRDDFTVKSSHLKIGSEATVSGKTIQAFSSRSSPAAIEDGPLDIAEAPTVRCSKG